MEQEFQARDNRRGKGSRSNGENRDSGPRTQAHGVAAVDRGAELLVRVLESKQPIALAELASASGIPKSTASRLMTALERRGLVEQDGPRGRLRPGPAILRLAERGLLERNVVEMSRESLDALGEATGETINLAVAGRDGVEHVAQVESRHFVGVGQWLGRAVEYHCTANGKVFLAFGRATLSEQPLRRYTPKTITDPAQLEAELETVRRQGFATTVDELETGLAAVAAPVRGAGGDVVAALSISGPTLRMTPRRIRELEPVLIEEAHSLERRLGHSEQGEAA
ncbi:MAG: IclR family transcriptional regulator [Solirubrobacteraceae bacterium]